MKKIAIVLVLTSSLVLPCVSTIFTNKAYAASACSKTNASGPPNSNCLPAWVVTDINYHCNTDHWGIVSDSWFSPVGNPSSTTVNVSQGDSSVDLDMNYIFYRCVVNPSTYHQSNENGFSEKNYFSVDKKNDGTIASLPASFEGTYPSPLKAETYNQSVIKTVKYSPSTPFQINSTKHIYLDSRGYFTDAISSGFVSYCSWVTSPEVQLINGISGTGNRKPDADATNCATQIADFSINVVISSINVQGTIYGPSGKITSAISLPAGLSSDLFNISLTPRGTCSAASATTDSAGAFTFNEKIGTGFCIRPPLTFKDSSNIFYSNLVITPYVAGDNKPPSSPYFRGCNNISTGYELQSAQIPNSNSLCSYVPPKINSNSGYDFLYQKAQRATIAATSSVSSPKAYPGDVVTFTSTAADSNTLPDDGTDTYSYSVTPSTTAGPSDTAFNGANCSASNTIGLLPEGSRSRNCSITIPASSTTGTTYCVTTTISNQPTYASVAGSPAQACVVVAQKPSIAVTGIVNGVSSASAEHEIGSTADVTMNVAISCNDFIGTIYYSVTSSPSLYSNSFSYPCTVANGPAATNPILILAATLNSSSPNTYVFTAAITAAAGVPAPLPSSTATLRNYTVPYTRFYGNDIASGSGSIYFNNHDNQPPTTSSAGSAAQYAAIAKTTILIATAAFRSTAPASPIGLSALTSAQVSIASTNNTSGATWANNWSTSGYYGDTTATTTINHAASSVASKITIVGNDIYIKGNITVDSTKLPSPSNLFDNASIPVITLIAAHNIYIDPSVTQIDALLQATNDIYTCSTGAAATPSAACSNTLLVNGEVGASNAIHFDRVCGTRLSATSTEGNTAAGTYMTNTNPNCSGSYKSGIAAEVINFPSYLYFASPYISGATQTQYQSIYSAPPLL